MIVKNISAIQYFQERFDIMDVPYQYTVDYHSDAPRKSFTTNPTFLAEFHDCVAHCYTTPNINHRRHTDYGKHGETTLIYRYLLLANNLTSLTNTYGYLLMNTVLIMLGTYGLM